MKNTYIKPLAALSLSAFHALVIYEIDPYGEWIVTGWSNEGDVYGIRRTNLYYNEHGGYYFRRANQKFLLNDFALI